MKNLIEQIKQISIVWLVPEVILENPGNMCSKYNRIICCNHTNLHDTISQVKFFTHSENPRRIFLTRLHIFTLGTNLGNFIPTRLAMPQV